MSFRVVSAPSESELAQLQLTDQANPFASAPYAAARRALGATVVLFLERSAREMVGGTIGYVHGRAISRSLEITSAIAPVDPLAFWAGVRAFCRKNRVAEAAIDSYGSRAATLPAWPVPASIRERTEWVLQLADGDASHLASNHRRNINKARKHGVAVTSTTDPAAAGIHAHLMAASMHRRSERGEHVPTISETDTRTERAFLASGAARIYQAVLQNEVVSSLLVLTSPQGAYYHSAGTTPEGMETGASTFLVSEIIRALADDGRLVFNLGGAGTESEGLRRFKSGFGAQPVALAAGVYQVASPLHRKLRAVVRLLR